MSCAQVVTPGFKVVQEAAGQRYEYHTDPTGGTVLLASAPQPEVKDAVVVWQKQDGVCETAQIGSQDVAFGACGGELMTGKFTSPERAAGLAYFVQTYASFTAETPAGKVNFTGQGAQQANPAEQRMIAEWAHLVFQEAAGAAHPGAWPLPGIAREVSPASVMI